MCYLSHSRTVWLVNALLPGYLKCNVAGIGTTDSSTTVSSKFCRLSTPGEGEKLSRLSGRGGLSDYTCPWPDEDVQQTQVSSKINFEVGSWSVQSLSDRPSQHMDALTALMCRQSKDRQTSQCSEKETFDLLKSISSFSDFWGLLANGAL